MRLFFSCFIVVLASCQSNDKINEPESWPFDGFVKVDELNPILTPSADQIMTCPISVTEVKWESRNVLNPSAVVKEGRVYLFYRAQDESGTSRIGLAISEDGLNFRKQPSPVFYPDNDNMKIYEWHYGKEDGMKEGLDYFDGVEDPRIIQAPDGSYIMTYTAYDGKVARLCHAVSDDLIQWKKLGLVLNDVKYRNTWSKAGAIVSELKENQVVARKVGGQYWMYYGDTDLFLMTSKDLVSWVPAVNEENNQRISVLHPRKGYFDSRLVEPGPFALYLEEGIHMVYNASNAANFNDPSLPKFTYAPGQALFDPEKPYKLIDRSETYLFKPDKPYEREGEVNEVCFVEGLVFFKGKWYLYYGTADSKIAVAVKNG